MRCSHMHGFPRFQKNLRKIHSITMTSVSRLLQSTIDCAPWKQCWWSIALYRAWKLNRWSNSCLEETHTSETLVFDGLYGDSVGLLIPLVASSYSRNLTLEGVTWNVCYLATGFLVSLFWPSGDAVKKRHCGDSEHKRRPIQPQINPVKQGNTASRRGKMLEVLVEVQQAKSLLQITTPTQASIRPRCFLPLL